MNTKHTPGPWIAADVPVDMSAQADFIASDIGTEREWTAVGTCDEDGFAEVVALCHPINARLIAAAPDLLAALDELCGILDVHADYWQNNQGQYGDILDSMDNARAAIAKAKGDV